MEGKTRSVSRRTRFIDDGKVLNSMEHKGSKIFQSTTTIPVHAVLHDATPDLGTNEMTVSRISENSPTLANLTDEFNDLTRKMTLLKETLKATRNESAKRTGPVQTNALSQVSEIANLSDVVAAKRVIHDCIAELTLANNFLDGNEETAAMYREKLQRVIAKECVNVGTIVIQGLSVAPINRKPMTRGENLVADSDIGASKNFFNADRRETAMQTEASEISMDRNITKSHVGTIDEVCEKSRQRERKKKRKWYSCCCGKGEKKSNENREKSNTTSSSKKSMSRRPEKSTPVHVVICDDDS